MYVCYGIGVSSNIIIQQLWNNNMWRGQGGDSWAKIICIARNLIPCSKVAKPYAKWMEMDKLFYNEVILKTNNSFAQIWDCAFDTMQNFIIMPTLINFLKDYINYHILVYYFSMICFNKKETQQQLKKRKILFLIIRFLWFFKPYCIYSSLQRF